MTIFVVGSTGNIGRQVVAGLAARGADVHALARDPAKAKFPAGVTVIKGDLTDIDTMRAALAGVSTLFLLNAVTPDEVTQALITLNLARDAGIERIVYLSVIHSDLYTNVPHFTGKFTVERMIEQFDMAATILRPAYFIDNDGQQKTALIEHGVYGMPIGSRGLSMVATRDIADLAVIELLRRERAPDPLPRTTVNVVGPDSLTGERVAAIWSDVLGKPIAYGGDDTGAFEAMLKQFSPSWAAYDLALMARRFQSDGMIPDAGDVERLEAMLGRPLTSYRAFATETAAVWAKA
ncbi:MULTISPECIES: NmrA/HSCARG family protein [Rhizobium]|uniref:NmrA/HSCARG family protein n=1 Tax=Rhizobium rhododendri TaxID=2506430 RepID=A0ABY8IJF6_9HYPH|nr:MULTISPECIES: NmrA/HSCARG family protein [Rhizobium]MBZ5761658.1 NmrA/HSCARG family protein [Rhizobium sp. VS19-DR96]MBZ5767834.1 NmrA/HSCARG family protein [Rhizobium sp. VS19-DR129.2]MBZ5773640.1 NmrA/HSCARG family protein [Rhizobium sp. VS19-DRK62.2]MBZ5786451.1 NmrA/HSCARG family protein [Rhizobium sp. VS19-DR121]MBZ5802204.1 NmrA/HSCARG family protein [Rhizobium sp. VS19-DR181]